VGGGRCVGEQGDGLGVGIDEQRFAAVLDVGGFASGFGSGFNFGFG